MVKAARKEEALAILQTKKQTLLSSRKKIVETTEQKTDSNFSRDCHQRRAKLQTQCESLEPVKDPTSPNSFYDPQKHVDSPLSSTVRRTLFPETVNKDDQSGNKQNEVPSQTFDEIYQQQEKMLMRLQKLEEINENLRSECQF